MPTSPLAVPATSPRLAVVCGPDHAPDAGPDAVFRQRFVVTEPGVWEYTMAGHEARPEGVPSVLDPVTGHWLVSTLTHCTSGEVAPHVSRPDLRYGRVGG